MIQWVISFSAKLFDLISTRLIFFLLFIVTFVKLFSR